MIVLLVCIIISIGSTLFNHHHPEPKPPEREPYPERLTRCIHAVQMASAAFGVLTRTLSNKVQAAIDTSDWALAASDRRVDSTLPCGDSLELHTDLRDLNPRMSAVITAAQAFDRNIEPWSPATQASAIMAQKANAVAIPGAVLDALAPLEAFASTVLRVVADWGAAYNETPGITKSQEMIDACNALAAIGLALRPQATRPGSPWLQSANALQASYLALYRLVEDPPVGLGDRLG